jgi:hypothetical protein
MTTNDAYRFNGLLEKSFEIFCDPSKIYYDHGCKYVDRSQWDYFIKGL